MFDINTSVLFKTGYTAAQLEAAVKAVRPDAGFNNYQAFVDAENQTGIASIYLVAHACEESGWGTELIAPNNLYGFNANDANPAGDASTFSSQALCISYVSNFLLQNYLNPNGRYYHGTTLHDIFVDYSSSHDAEANIVASIMNLVEAKINAQTPPQPQTEPAPAATSTVYTVKEGDTLSSIAADYGLTLAQLEQMNPSAGHPSGNFDLIQPGDQIVIDSKEAAPQADNASYYTVQPGDSLYAIAQRHGISLGQIEDLNPTAGHPAGNFSNIWVGDKIRVS